MNCSNEPSLHVIVTLVLFKMHSDVEIKGLHLKHVKKITKLNFTVYSCGPSALSAFGPLAPSALLRGAMAGPEGPLLDKGIGLHT
jgi:hypothetical protein